MSVKKSNQVSLDELQSIIRQFIDERDWDQFHNPKDLAIGLSTESNELLDLFRFKSEEQMREMLNDPEKKERISEELSDCVSVSGSFTVIFLLIL